MSRRYSGSASTLISAPRPSRRAVVGVADEHAGDDRRDEEQPDDARRRRRCGGRSSDAIATPIDRVVARASSSTASGTFHSTSRWPVK